MAAACARGGGWHAPKVRDGGDPHIGKMQTLGIRRFSKKIRNLSFESRIHSDRHKSFHFHELRRSLGATHTADGVRGTLAERGLAAAEGASRARRVPEWALCRSVASGMIRGFLKKLYLPANKLNIDSVAELEQTNQGGNYGL